MATPDSAPVIYVIDSSGWISIENHPAQNRILYSLSELIGAGRIQCPPEVWGELRRCDEVLAWIKHEREKIVRREADIAYFNMVGRVFFDFPAMCGARGSKEK